MLPVSRTKSYLTCCDFQRTGPHGLSSEDAVVVLAHMDYRDDLVDFIWRSLRLRLGETKPIQVFAGHSHIRGYRRNVMGMVIV